MLTALVLLLSCASTPTEPPQKSASSKESSPRDLFGCLVPYCLNDSPPEVPVLTDPTWERRTWDRKGTLAGMSGDFSVTTCQERVVSITFSTSGRHGVDFETLMGREGWLASSTTPPDDGVFFERDMRKPAVKGEVRIWGAEDALTMVTMDSPFSDLLCGGMKVEDITVR